MFYHKLLLCALFVFPLKVIRTRFIYDVSVCECVYVCDWQMFCLTNVISLIQITLQMLSLSHSLPINMRFLLSLSCFVARTVIKAFALHLNFCTFGAHLSKNAPKLFSILFLWQIFVVFAALTVY